MKTYQEPKVSVFEVLDDVLLSSQTDPYAEDKIWEGEL